MNSTTSDRLRSVTRAGGQPESPSHVTSGASGARTTAAPGSPEALEEILTRYHGTTRTGLRPAIHAWVADHDRQLR